MYILFIQKGNIVPQCAFQVNSLLAVAEIWDLKGCKLKVKLWKQFSLYKQYSLGKPDPYDSLTPCKNSAVSYFINFINMAQPKCPPIKSYIFFSVL
jgi:hypothetical protein